jgi:hypothetical protein
MKMVLNDSIQLMLNANSFSSAHQSISPIPESENSFPAVKGVGCRHQQKAGQSFTTTSYFRADRSCHAMLSSYL